MTVAEQQRNLHNPHTSQLRRRRPLRLPDEVLGIVFLHLQPNYVRQDGLLCGTPWTDGTCVVSREMWQDGNSGTLIRHDWTDDSKRGKARYHPTITINRVPSRRHCRPALLDVGAVNRQWRRVSLQHPFWTDLGWHRLLDLRPVPLVAASATAGGPTVALDSFFRVLSDCPVRMARVRSITLDLVCWRRDIGIDALLAILRRVTNPHLVHTFVLETGWDVSGDTAIIRLLGTQFPNLRRVHVGGVASPDIFYGLASSALKYWAKRWGMGKLTHLSLQGFGQAGSFSCAALLALLKKQRNVKHLAVGYVRNGLDLTRVAALVPELETLSHDFMLANYVPFDARPLPVGARPLPVGFPKSFL
ncbi:hypothetical protein HDU87_008425 [Geranomyces variabilis]|uniref:F-box domain-containing protein n=1 Tax=Geranomyces variabilis TaxID=109894 RepID=A0AAD5TCQ3_9FUNG|nr:hypothetical protein HDU87_008425 [Geranomyces variabilis]